MLSSLRVVILALTLGAPSASAQEPVFDEAFLAAVQDLLAVVQGKTDGTVRVRAFERRGEVERATFEVALGRATDGSWSLEVQVDGRRARLHVDPIQGSALEVGHSGRVIAGFADTSNAAKPGCLEFDELIHAAGRRWSAIAFFGGIARNVQAKTAISVLTALASLMEQREERAWRLQIGEAVYVVRLERERDAIREIAREDGALRFEIAREEFTAFAPPTDAALVQHVGRIELERSLERAILRAAELVHEAQSASEPADEVQREEAGELHVDGGRRTLLLGGEPHSMGRAHGKLLSRQVRANVEATLGVVGIVYTVERERWFLAEIRDAWQRLEPHVAPRFLAELDGIADGAGLSREDVRLANVFPELFHCSGFALFGGATASGEMLHGRVLDYMTEIGLQRNAVLLVQAPESALAFANVGYAGFLGSVTGCNERGLSIGEMGGRGEGDWDGEPMAFLLRRALEEAPDLDAALQIYKRAPRTCEYFYVLAHGPTRRAVGLAAWPKRLEILAPGAAHELLPHAVPDAVLLSAGGRYEELVRRVREGYGTFDVESALHLMDPGVAMKSNLHNALFALERDELRISHAGGQYHAFTLTPLFAAARSLSLH